MLETTRNCWNPLEPAGSAVGPPLRTLWCRPKRGQSPRLEISETGAALMMQIRVPPVPASNKKEAPT
eukprot:5262103-Alexandrium_andersonii.AAC.1